jgi:NADPH-dependent glutamate synthase beta subunit-like oxidoreductase/ferredoxin
MPKLFVDNREVEVADGATILDAAKKLEIEIPTMCFLEGHKALTSCMLCVVKISGSNSFVPACGSIAREGMRIESDCEEVRQARIMALELLLSDHLGDCMGPCQVICPAGMNIPLMIRQIASGKIRDAIATVKKDIALPAVLGRICPRPCERGCRRAAFDEPVSICLLKRYVADLDLQSGNPYLPACKASRGKRVAIVGAGPAGLAAAYYLQQDGFNCVVFDEHEKPGGMLRYGVSQQQLPREVLEAEIALIERLGVKFQGQTRVGDSLSVEDLRGDFDAVLIAVGELKPDDAAWMGLKMTPDGIVINGETYQTNLAGVFSGGDCVRRRRLAVRAVADGKEAAISIGQYLFGQIVTGVANTFNTHIGKLKNGEIEKFVACASKAHRLTPLRENGGFTNEQASEEASRCLHCDCRKAESCKLRQYAQDYEARPGRYKSERRLFEQQTGHPQVIYEPGKCISCGLCVQIAAQASEKLGLSFVGRGFDVRVTVPFGKSIAEGLTHTARQCVAACPTGALAFKSDSELRTTKSELRTTSGNLE